MSRDALSIVLPGGQPVAAAETLSLRDLSAELASGAILRRFARYRRVIVCAPHPFAFHRAGVIGLLARLCSRGHCVIASPAGDMSIDWADVPARVASLALEVLTAPLARARLAADAKRLGRRRSPKFVPAAPPVYLRADLDVGLAWGGMITHITGVLRGLEQTCGTAVVLATALPLAVPPRLEVASLPVTRNGWDMPELAPVLQGRLAARAAQSALKDRPVGFVYQRNNAFSLAGLGLAQRRCVPFVLEFNGSEPWMARHWAGGLRYEALAQAVEDANLAGADLVVTVSEASRQEVLARGVPAKHVVMAPNGVDTDRFSPTVDGAAVRHRLGLDGRFVIGFSGSFGPWHGAEMLAAAFRLACEQRPDAPLSLLLLGDGPCRKAARDLLPDGAALVETGALAPDDMPAHLAACDVLVSPQVPNTDGSPFFGSPTKLFEYLAMGKPVIASALDQMNDILSHGDTALLVPPGDAEALAAALLHLHDDAHLCARLAQNARQQAEDRHTWRAHVAHIIQALGQVCPCG